MNIIYFLLPMALCLGAGFAVAFAYCSSRGQFDDLETPAHRMLLDMENENKIEPTESLKGKAHE